MNVVDLDQHNVSKPCVICNNTVVTTARRIPVCIRCRERGVVGCDELAAAQAANKKIDAWHKATLALLIRAERVLIDLRTQYEDGTPMAAEIDAILRQEKPDAV